MSSRTARATQRNPVSEKKKKRKEKKRKEKKRKEKERKEKERKEKKTTTKILTLPTSGDLCRLEQCILKPGILALSNVSPIN